MSSTVQDEPQGTAGRGGIGDVVRALRLPFVSVIALPFVFGWFLVPVAFDAFRFTVALFAVAVTHLSAALMNDYGDSQTGADWQDPTYYGLFGGSKLIQEGVFSARFYRTFAVALGAAGAVAAGVLSVQLHNPLCVILYVPALLFAWSYTARPLRLAYHGLGEIAVFLMYGPAPVLGGYFVASGRFPPAPIFLLSLPLGLLTAAALAANEVPDAPGDVAAGKRNLVVRMGPQRGVLLYVALTLAALACVVAAVLADYLTGLSLAALVATVPAYAATRILRRHWADKRKLLVSSKLAIVVHTLVNLVLLIEVAVQRGIL